METSQKHNCATFLSLCGGRSHLEILPKAGLILPIQTDRYVNCDQDQFSEIGREISNRISFYQK